MEARGAIELLMELWLTDASGNGIVDPSLLAISIIQTSALPGFVMNGIYLDAHGGVHVTLYNPTTGAFIQT
jgi:hypothetical protein